MASDPMKETNTALKSIYKELKEAHSTLKYRNALLREINNKLELLTPMVSTLVAKLMLPPPETDGKEEKAFQEIDQNVAAAIQAAQNIVIPTQKEDSDETV